MERRIARRTGRECARSRNTYHTEYSHLTAAGIFASVGSSPLCKQKPMEAAEGLQGMSTALQKACLVL